ncbi:hypothetical protein NONI108955_28070 [Nocardia ninae]|uniref:Uncharacterized protein n=1 Tax=Nocardia ninae NBRC 108245 TaxID=1210091 RepID=A0A511MHE1_9NOCA|nr:hypothetical protein [Nocardia ninae]GEM40072.1 hypothetical protein NN4_45910 [Nocardia ninae NBRC 108245]
MSYEWNDRLETDYTRYVGGKWFQGLNARDREGYRKSRDQWKRSRDMGNRFRDGMALLRGQTPERGYEKEVRHDTPKGPRVHDVANVLLRDGNEYKAGRVDKEKALPQLEKEEHLLKLGYQINWTVVQGARVDREVLDRFQELNKKWGRQFDVQEITREQRRLALTIGKHLEKQKRAKEKEARALERAEKERQRVAQQKAVELAKERAEQNRKMQQFREAAARGRADAPERVAQERKTLDVLQRVARERAASEAERDRVARESAERVAREFPFPAPSQSQERETVEIGGRVASELADAASVEREAAEREATKERERAAKLSELNKARDAAFKERQSRMTEAERLAWLGQAVHPQGAVLEPPGHAPGVERGGTGQGPDRTRGITRDGR